MNYTRIALAFLLVLSSAWAANNPDITVGVVADVDRFVQIGMSKTFKATLHWPDGVTKDTGKFKWELWFVNPDSGSGTFSPEEKVGNDTCETMFTGTKSGAINVAVRWVPDHPDQYDQPVGFATVYVVRLVDLLVTDATDLGGDNFVATKSTGDVTIEAVLDPNYAADSLPPNFIQWTGGQAGNNQCERKVTRTISALTDIMVQCGTSYDSATIIVADIQSDTVLTAPDGTADTRHTIGVCEKVDFSITPTLEAQWTASGGTPTSGQGTSWRWQAPETPTSITITAVLGSGVSLTATMTVVSPIGITGTKTYDWSTAGGDIPAGGAGAGMQLDMQVDPTSVCFGYLEASEVPSGGEGIQGYFQQFPPAQLAHTTAGHWFAISNDNLWFDTAAVVGLPKPWADGQYHWTIPNHYRCAGTSGSGHLYATTTQLFSLRASGETTVSKVGQSSTRTP